MSGRAKANGYQKGAHRNKDSLGDRNKHVDKVKMDQNTVEAIFGRSCDSRSANRFFGAL